jgi:FlaA1/EpsC-like NDP-sugar epimerase
MDLEIVGFVDDDPLKQRTVIQGIKVLGTTRDLPDLVRAHDIDRVVITLAQVDRQTIRSIVEICERCRVRTRDPRRQCRRQPLSRRSNRRSTRP